MPSGRSSRSAPRPSSSSTTSRRTSSRRTRTSTTPPSAGSTASTTPSSSRAKQKPECFQDLCTTTGPTYYLFDENTKELIAGPAEEEEDLFLDSPDGEQPEGTEVLSVPQGTVVVQAEPPSDDPATELDESAGAPLGYFVLKDRPEVEGDQIKDPKQETDQSGQPNVTFTFTDEGRESFAEVTARIAQRGAAKPGAATACQTPGGGGNFSDHFAIVLDNEIVSRPIIDFCENPEGIDGRTGAQISGSFTITEAQDLAKFLQIGALPVDLTLVSQSTVSATLGEEALDQGLKAGLIGLILVLLFLIAYYRVLGIVAGLGLLIYAVFFLAMIKLIPITLTLPGIAGLVLTIGVAADANVVIFERIKEEARAGKSMASAIATGYRKGIATIIDANVITLITAFILFVLASAGVKGFAFTLGIGTIVSLFTAVLFTQAILGVFGRARFMRSPAALGASGEGDGWHFDFIGASRWFFSISGIILLVGAFAFATKQLNLGIDFESGTRITVEPGGGRDGRGGPDGARRRRRRRCRRGRDPGDRLHRGRGLRRRTCSRSRRRSRRIRPAWPRRRSRRSSASRAARRASTRSRSARPSGSRSRAAPWWPSSSRCW